VHFVWPNYLAMQQTTYDDSSRASLCIEVRPCSIRMCDRGSSSQLTSFLCHFPLV